MKLEEYRRKLELDPEYVAAEEELRPLLDLADEVLRLRLQSGWSQSELARRAGTQQSNISRIEAGLGNPTLKFIQRLADALGTGVEIRLRPCAAAGRGAEPVAEVEESALHWVQAAKAAPYEITAQGQVARDAGGPGGEYLGSERKTGEDG